MLKEVDLAALRVAHLEPIWVGQPLAEVTIANVWVAELGGLCRPWECFSVHLVKLVHEFTSECRYSGVHRAEVAR